MRLNLPCRFGWHEWDRATTANGDNVFCARCGAIQPRVIHTIPVPRGWTPEQAWEAIRRGDLLTDPEPGWANVETRGGRFVRLHAAREDNHDQGEKP